MSPTTFTVFVPSATISSYVPDLCCVNNLSPLGVSSISDICPDSDSCTWLKGYCPVSVPVVSTPLGLGSLNVMLTSFEVLVDTDGMKGFLASTIPLNWFFLLSINSLWVSASSPLASLDTSDSPVVW